jgi:hypothetical protein
MSEPATTAIVRHPNPHIGLVGGRVVHTHPDGTVTIQWGGRTVTGKPLSADDIAAAENVMPEDTA